MATNDKYDRQLRLWGANGQRKLAECCVVLINATAVGTETLKNLVLPGIGSFHIVDDAQVSPSQKNEPFSNFFVFHTETKADDVEYRAKSRAEIATQHLLELNPDVVGSYSTVDSLQYADYSSILTSLASRYSSLLVIAADLPSCVLLPISNLCWNGLGRGNNSTPSSLTGAIPLIIVKSYGLIGSVRVQTPHHPIIESKPDNPKPDLRLASTLRNPASFPELQNLADETNLDEMDSKQHCHVPYVILLLKAMEKWRKEKLRGAGENDSVQTRLPKGFEEKNTFQKTVSSLAKNMEQELNFIEAVKNYYLAYTELEIPCEVQELLDNIDDNIFVKTDVSASSNNTVDTFDVLVLALKKFVERHDGFPPLNGSIPDMTASTKAYIDLQKVYKDRSEKDKSEMRSILEELTDKYGGKVVPTVSDEELNTFCKNIYNLRLVRTRSFEQEYNFEYGNNDEDEDILGDLIMNTFDPYEVPEHTPLLWHIALRACDAFYDDYGHYPGHDGRELALESDASCVQKYIVNIVEKMKMADNDLVKSTLLSTSDGLVSTFAKEVTRYNNAEVHNIASIVGGVASQEAVKLITRQYIPMEGTYIYNGIACVAGTLKL
jgi:amyloid beta precursor protein binding protein 1